MEVSYDTALPAVHSYMGEDLTDLSGRNVLDPKYTHRILVMTNRGVTLVPGQCLPLLLYHPSEVQTMKRVLRKDRVFGVLYPGQERLGTTAEVRSFKEETDEESGVSTLLLKTEGGQRFELVDDDTSDIVLSGFCIEEVRILKEMRLHTAGRKLLIEGERPSYKTLAKLSGCPEFAWRSCDENILMEEVSKGVRNLVGKDIPSSCDPCWFSYWVAANLPVNDDERVKLLGAGSAQERLRMTLDMLQLECSLVCSNCNIVISTKEDMLSMSKDGVHGTYVNPMGHVHEMVTVKKISNLRHYGRSSEEYSWFPGYAWTIAECSGCTHHMGWKFQTSKELQPREFWGLSRASIRFRIKGLDDLNDGGVGVVEVVEIPEEEHV